MIYPSETIEAMTRFLFIGKPIEELGKNDLVIVLGNNLIELTINELKRVWDEGHIIEGAKIILSGKVGSLNKDDAPEAEDLFKLALKKGLPENSFILEPESRNAYENFLYSKEKINELGGFDQFNSILCIGQAFLLRRAKMCAAKCGYPHEKLTYYGTVDKNGRNIGPDTWWTSDVARTRVLEEIGRISTYTLKGDLSID